MNIGVVVGRFQATFLTDGHKAVIKAAYEENENLIVFISEETVPFSINSPLPYEVRENMIKEELRILGNKKLVQFYKLMDFKYSSTVIDVIDQVLIHKHGGTTNNFTLYFGPTAFLGDRYNGIGKVKIIDNVLVRASSRRLRQDAYDMNSFNVSHHAGMIHAVGNRPPTAHVFICHVILHGTEKVSVLTLKEPQFKKLSLPLYHVAGIHEKIENQAKEWLKTQFPTGICGEPKLAGVTKVDDWRFRNSEDFALYITYISRLFSGTEIPDTWIKKQAPFSPEEWESEFFPIIPIIIRQNL